MGSDEKVTVNTILRRLESQAISSMVSASEEMSQDKGHLYWTEGDILWSIEEDCAEPPASALYIQCKVIFIHCSGFSSVLLTNNNFM